MKDVGITDHTFAWMLILLTHHIMWGPQAYLFAVWNIFGWGVGANIFYIQHLISNFNMFAYGISIYVLANATYKENTWNVWVSLISYLIFTWMFYVGEWRLGTDAIRHLDNDFYLDPRLYPSLFYGIGLLSHRPKPIKEIVDEDTTQGEDILEEEGDASAVEKRLHFSV